MKILLLIKNKSVAALASKIASAGLSFVFLWTMARVMPAADAGVFLYTYSLMMILVQLSRAGTEHSIIKILNTTNDQQATFVITTKISFYVFCICLILTLACLFGNVVAPLQIYESEAALKVLFAFCLVSLTFSVAQVLGSYFQARSEVYSQYWAMNVGLMLLGSSYALFNVVNYTQISAVHMGMILVLLSSTVLISCLVLFWISIKNLPRDKHVDVLDEITFIRLGRQTLPYATITFLSISILWGAQISAGFWLGNVDLAILSVCMRLAVLVNFVHMTFEALLAPRIARLHSSGNLERLMRVTHIHAGISKAYAIIVLIVYFVYGKEILNSFGPEYKAGYVPLVTISLSWFVVTCFGPVNIIMLMTGHTKKFRTFLLISGVATIASSFALVPNFGVMGAVLSTSLGTLLLAVISSNEVYKIFRFSYMQGRVLTMQLKSFRQALSRFFAVSS
ncbi:hypothetical protein PS900_04189 [Pseudomonas fluorescens]|uniref:Polysaccharide biosynthesis protein C-terminal domain-containing protein n=1 Tax=Pseudomonas fluorescens TaxID=294 RepID=A0A8H2RSH7_PSEFL|nr:oligosaccharide flippase family protein [Pseudomonas fluorescens]VVP27687.1 hypothetical protein PS900_04189 [Pseudomonas fluorescens]